MNNIENQTGRLWGEKSDEERENVQQNGTMPSLENPTRDFLLKNFTVSELRRHCRQLGLPKVWVKKEELVEMILRSTQSSSYERAADTQESDPQTMDLLRSICQELDDIKGNMAKKDSEIEELNEMLKKAHVTINRLNDRITTLEDQI